MSPIIVGAVSSDELASAGGASLVGFGSRTVEDKLNDSVSVYDFGAGGADDTAAFNAAMQAVGVGGKISGKGNFRIGPLTYPTGARTIEIEGSLTLMDTLTIPSCIHLKGIGGATSPQFGVGECMVIVPPPGSVPTLRVVGSADHSIENVSILGPSGPGILVDGSAGLSALVKLKNVNINCNVAVATAVPIKVEGGFWVWIEGGSLMTVDGTYGYTLWMNQESATPAYTGLISVRDTVVSGHGFLVRSLANALNGPFQFKDITYENCLNDFLTLDIRASAASSIVIDNVLIADASASQVHMINSLVPNSAMNVRLVNADTNQRLINPTSAAIDGLSMVGGRRFSYSSLIPSNIPPSTRQFEKQIHPGVIDIDWIGNRWAGGPGAVPGTIYQLSQDPATWVGQGGTTFTTGVIAPDGTPTAIEITGANGGYVDFNAIPIEAAIDDWLIWGCWIRTASGSDYPSEPTLGLLASPDYRFNGGANSQFTLDGYEHRQDDRGWHFATGAGKITTVGANATPLFFSRYNKQVGHGVTQVCWPFLLRIPAGTLSDRDVLMVKRSLRGYSPGAVAGDVAVLNHQKLKLGGGARIFSAPIAPTSGAWLRGDRVINSMPSVGQPKGWVCVAGGSPGTWVSEGNL